VFRDPDLWTEDASTIREIDLTISQTSVWEATDPVQALARDRNNPGQALPLAAKTTRGTRPGMRPGPSGTLTDGDAVAVNTPVTRRERAPSLEPPPSLDESQDPLESSSPMPMPMPMPNNSETGDEASTAINVPTDLNEFLPMGVDHSPRQSDDAPGVDTEAEPEPESFTQTRAETTPNPDVVTSPAGPKFVNKVAAGDSPPTIRSAKEFRNAIGRSSGQDQGLLVPADADWVLSSTPLGGKGPWSIRAVPGPTRPRIRFQPTPADPKEPFAPSVWLELRSGELELEGIDIVLPRSNAPQEGRWAAFGVWAGAKLSLSNCTVTIEGEGTNSAVVVIHERGVRADGEEEGRRPPATMVQLNDSLLRAGGDLIDVAPGGRLDLNLNNLAVSTGGSLLHAHGSPRGQMDSLIQLNLEQVTARMAGGLILLASAPDEPELPVVEVVARKSVLATTPDGGPLVRVDGQDALTTLHDRIRWQGDAVAYHRIETYRRDQSAQPGAIPTSYDRQSWQVAVGLREASAVHGDMKFVNEWDATDPAWSLQGEDLKLAPESLALSSSSGAVLERIPQAPPAESP